MWPRATATRRSPKKRVELECSSTPSRSWRKSHMFRSLSAGSPQDKADRRRPIRLGAALIAVLGMLLGPLALAASAATTPHATTPVMGSYVSVTPFRITDTRAGSGQPNAGKSLAANSTLNVQVTRVGTEPVPAGTAAVVLNEIGRASCRGKGQI